MSDITAFEALAASESEGKIAKQAAADKLAAAIYDVREQYGAHLFCAKSKEEFHDRVALCKDDMIKTVNAHLMPVTGVMRKVCKAMEREWQQKLAFPEDVTVEAAPAGPRALHEIARDIKRNWPKVNYAAQPYLDALHQLDSVDDMYYQDPARHIVNYFLSNAGTWRGPEAKRIKDELKAMVRGASRVAYSDEDLAAYKDMFDHSPVGGQHASQSEGNSEEWHPSYKKADNTGPVMDIDETYSPSDADLIPEGNFQGYLDSVDQGAPSKVDQDFTAGGDSGKQARRRVAVDGVGGSAPSALPTSPEPAPAPGSGGNMSVAPQSGAGITDMSPPGFNQPDNMGGMPPVMASVIKRYAQWCVDNLARPSYKTMEYYAARRPDQEYFILASALQRTANTRTAGSKDYLQQADEAITNLLNEKAEEFQESIQPLQQALQTIQYAEQVQQAQNPMNVMPPAGTVNVLPQTQGPQGPAPQGVDPSTGQIDPAILQQLMGQGGMDPSAMAGGAQGGPPPAAAAQGALPPEVAQQMQMQARRRYASAASEIIEELRATDPNDVKSYELEDALHHLAEQGDPEAVAYLSSQGGIGDDEHFHSDDDPYAYADESDSPYDDDDSPYIHEGAVSELGYDWPVDEDEDEYHPDPRTPEEYGKPKSKKDAGRRGGYPKG